MRIIYILIFFFGVSSTAQTALYNSGNIKIHADGKLGFHTNLINDAAFDENEGLTGFYGNNQLIVSGALSPTFFDTEIANASGVFLQTGINNLNNTNFVIGDFMTPRDQPDAYYSFLQNAFYVGDSDISKIDGYASVSNQQNFTFPIGDLAQLRPLVLNSQGVNLLAYSAYFFEDPNSPNSINETFNTSLKSPEITAISSTEFWRLGGDTLSTISISWNDRSGLTTIATDLNEIIIVGWHKASQQWVNLAGSSAVGDLNQGFTTSLTFIPDDYGALTFGSVGEAQEYVELDNFYVSVNSDGINDTFVIPELDQSPNNHLQIYNRYGQKVFDQINYTDQFRGFSNVDNFVIGRQNGLPKGVYFYIVTMEDLNLDFQGFLYLTR